jgi:hypothetical protein
LNIDLNTVSKVTNYWQGQNYSIGKYLGGLGCLICSFVPISGLAKVILKLFYSLSVYNNRDHKLMLNHHQE